MFANGLLCITLPKDRVDWILAEKPEEILVINWEEEKGAITWTGNDGVKFLWFTLSDHQKELISNGGSVGVMIKLAAELQGEGKI